MEVIIIGGGGFAKQVIDVFELTGVTVLGFLDDDQKKTHLLSYPRLGGLDHRHPQAYYFCGIGNLEVRERIFREFPGPWLNCIHPTAIISKHSTMGLGNYLGPGACLMPGGAIGNNNILDPHAVISHDSYIADHNHLAAQSCLLGGVQIGSGNLIGTGAVVLPKLTLGEKNTIGAGAVVTKSIEDRETLVGVPAKALIK